MSKEKIKKATKMAFGESNLSSTISGKEHKLIEINGYGIKSNVIIATPDGKQAQPLRKIK